MLSSGSKSFQQTPGETFTQRPGATGCTGSEASLLGPCLSLHSSFLSEGPPQASPACACLCLLSPPRVLCTCCPFSTSVPVPALTHSCSRPAVTPPPLLSMSMPTYVSAPAPRILDYNIYLPGYSPLGHLLHDRRECAEFTAFRCPPKNWCSTHMLVGSKHI